VTLFAFFSVLGRIPEVRGIHGFPLSPHSELPSNNATGKLEKSLAKGIILSLPLG